MRIHVLFAVVCVAAVAVAINPGDATATVVAPEFAAGLDAELNAVVREAGTPDDKRFDELWAMTKIAAPTAWDTSTGDGSVVVGVIDGGISANHADLRDNLWRNPGGVWGCPAGTIGYDAYHGDCTPEEGGTGHGVHVAGTVGAVGNNGVGVAGVSWNVQLMTLKVGHGGYGLVSDLIAGIDDAVAARQAGVDVRVLSISLVTEAASDLIREAVQRARDAGIVVVTAAGNSGRSVDQYGVFPCVHADICVAATGRDDHRMYWSNYGNEVDIAAPGDDILSTTPGGYQSWDGTSMATPHVAGAIALLAQTGNCRSMTGAQPVALLLNAADTGPDLGIVGDRRLNVGRALAGCGANPPPTGPPTLTNRTWVENLHGAPGSEQRFVLTVPAGQRKVVFTTKKGTGNADIRVQLGTAPVLCQSEKPKNAETCVIQNPAAGTYSVTVVGRSAYASLRLRGVFSD